MGSNVSHRNTGYRVPRLDGPILRRRVDDSFARPYDASDRGSVPSKNFLTRGRLLLLPSAALGSLAPVGESARWYGCHARDVTHFLWPVRGLPRQTPVTGSQMRMVLSMDADASFFASGEKLSVSTQLECPTRVLSGICVSGFQVRTVVSPEPDASIVEHGEKTVVRIASAWPGSVAVQRVTERTRNMDCGWYVSATTFSVLVSADAERTTASVLTSSTRVSVRKKVYGSGSSFCSRLFTRDANCAGVEDSGRSSAGPVLSPSGEKSCTIDVAPAGGSSRSADAGPALGIAGM
jgi:hypothetical protein